MFIKDGKRFNIYQAQEFDGVRYPNFLDPGLRTHLGIVEINDPVPPADFDAELYYVTEQDDTPYTVYTKRSQEQIDQVLLGRAKRTRTNAVAAITVTTASGKEFDGNEEAQGRMARALCALDDGESTNWVLSGNQIASVTKVELKEALKLAGAAQTALWMLPYV